MKTWMVLACLLTWLGADAKRFDASLVDPLMRRSSLDKNFMRFGRSSPAFTEDEPEDGLPAETNKEDSFLRSMRGKDNFIRFGRGKTDNFMRFGRGKQDSYMRFGRGKQDSYMRFGRGKQENFMRFGKGKQDSYMRFGRGKQDSYMRFGRGKQENFMRFGRGKEDNFMRFGKGRTENFMRFGRSKDSNYMRFGRNYDDLNNLPESVDEVSRDVDLDRSSRGKQDNFMRFGRDQSTAVDDDIPIAMRSGGTKGNSNFIRFGRSRQDNFMRFGKSVDKNIQEDTEDKLKDISNDLDSPSNRYSREAKVKDFNLIRLGRHPPTKNDAFMRFGRDPSDAPEESSENDFIPQRLKRSLQSFDDENTKDSTDEHASFISLPDDLEEEYSTPIHREDYNSRKKRSLKLSESTVSPPTEEDSTVDYISAKFRLQPPASLISAGLPNVIVGPEFSLLPALDPPSRMLKRGRPGDQSFLRLG